jgi:hypothetical protein
MPNSRKSNRNTWLIIIAVGLVAGYYWLRQQIDLIQVGSISIPFQKLDGTNIELGIKLPVVNASALAARITGFTGFILTPDGNVISTVFLKRPVVVKRYEQTELDFTSTIRASDIAGELFKILSSGKAPNWKGYRIKGQLRIYGLPLPVDETLV